MGTDTRTSRATDSRAAEETHEVRETEGLEDFDFSPANLDMKNIPPRDGYDQRWVRTKIGSEDDPKNVYRSTNQGWRPRLADTVKKGQYVMQVDFNGENVIGLHDLVLMERPQEISDKYKAYEQKLADDQIQAAQNDIHQVHSQNSGLTRPESRSNSSVSQGSRKAPISPD